MPDPVWFRSLHRRIAIGFVAMLAVVLSLQAACSSGSPTLRRVEPDAAAARRSRWPASCPTHSPTTPALDLENTSANATTTWTQAFAVILRDGRKAANGPASCRRTSANAHRAGRSAMGRHGSGRAGGRAPALRAAPRGSRSPLRLRRRRGGPGGGRPPGAPSISPIVVNSTQIGRAHRQVPRQWRSRSASWVRS